MDKAIEKLLNVNMGIHKGERVLVFTDHMQEGRLVPKEMDRCRRLEKAAERVAELSAGLTSTQFFKYDSLPSSSMIHFPITVMNRLNLSGRWHLAKMQCRDYETAAYSND